jgi:outer membrane murein-binding lipoprotein Lpp
MGAQTVGGACKLLSPLNHNESDSPEANMTRVVEWPLSFPFDGRPLQALESKLKGSNGSAADAPPALAATGFKWVLVKEGQEAAPPPSAAAAPAGTLQRDSSADDLSAPAPPADDESLKVGGSLLWGAATSASRSGLGGGGGSGRARDQQVAALQLQVRQLEATRDQLSEELVRTATEAAAGQAARAGAAAAEARVEDLQERLAAALELLGEKEELLEEAMVDMEEMRANYRQQIEFMFSKMQEQEAGSPQNPPPGQ